MVEHPKLQVSTDWTKSEREGLALLIGQDILALRQKEIDFQNSIPWERAVFMGLRESIRNLVIMKQSVYDSDVASLESNRSKYANYLVSN